MFKLFKLVEIYNKLKSQTYFFHSRNKKVSLVIQDARVTQVLFNSPNPSPDDVKDAINQGAEYIESEVKKSFGL
ncbi:MULTISPECIES: hypothetical protein [Flectobacillus]|uniref:hypothetical protein n=1 Tax=Flectobacillus TaxID=101 RepID=UPI000BA363B5|nr:MULTISPECIES: hypothetical protein [Flectobacillus]MDI9872758.1 hypothetical protein [Flectobacillus roseus]NBA78703.1 hypothetical protein [Emticicia sp. ODNR4P]PAC27011.1 hypothetical protein BWI92_24130 [Flectobacillus sp. BAB-3569]